MHANPGICVHNSVSGRATSVHHPTGLLWDAHPTFNEYFDGDTGVGLGVSHQTGWTALVVHVICAPDGIDTR